MKPISSATTGALAQVQRALNSTGREHGETGSGRQLTTSESERIAWLVARRPEEVDRALQASLMSSLGVDLELVSEWRFPSDAKPYQVAVGCQIGGNASNYAAALQRLEAASIPAAKDQIEEWLAALQVATAGARKSETAEALGLAVYAGALARYPADVAHTACVRLATTMKWFPVLADIIAMCDRLSQDRQSMIRALARKVG